MLVGKLGDPSLAAFGKRIEHAPARPVGERAEERVEAVVRILNHTV